MNFNFPDNFTHHPLIENIEGKIVKFIDGSTAEIDTIIACTGYQHSFPFMQDDLRLKTTNRYIVDNLWKGTVF